MVGQRFACTLDLVRHLGSVEANEAPTRDFFRMIPSIMMMMMMSDE